MKPNIINKHKGCPNKGHCEKDDTKCCFLINQKCLIRETRKEAKKE